MRIALDLTAADLCRRAGIATNTYSQWENAKGRPELDKAIKLVDAFGVTLDWLYLGNAAALPNKLATSIAELERRLERRGA